MRHKERGSGVTNSVLRVVLGDQLSARLEIIKNTDKKNDIFLMAEMLSEASYVAHHVKKIAFIFSAMRHFANALQAAGFTVRYVQLEDVDNTQNLNGEILRAVDEVRPGSVSITEPGEWRLLDRLEALRFELRVPLNIIPDTRFLCTHSEFDEWASARRELRMEYFYRDMRRRYNILMDENDKPEGGRWNFDTENRRSPREGLCSAARPSFRKDAITQDVLDLVRRRFPDNYGRLEPFYFSVTRRQALRELSHFIDKFLPDFGVYQDAMVKGQPYLSHSLLSAYMNTGLLYPLEICRRAELAFREGRAPLNAVEGFIRQILGWREYVRGVYWRFMPGYEQSNALNATERLPRFYWDGKTQMACMREALEHTYDHAYSHHIQRLMITGNFALLAGLIPKEVHEWYLSVYADAFEWVEIPNTMGMALHADGGLLASKPYAASGNYINRMSNFCKECVYDPSLAVGKNSCPFNSLFWAFVARHRERFRSNVRMKYIYGTWDKMGSEKQDALLLQGETYLTAMRDGRL